MTDLKGLTNKRSGIAAYPLTESDIAATPEYAARTRRLRFYARNGWIDTGIHAIDCGVDFELLTRRRPVPPGTQMDIIKGFWESLAKA